jgi:hypothetical protein
MVTVLGVLAGRTVSRFDGELEESGSGNIV